MPFTLTMPKLSPTMEMGTIVKWHKAIGDYVDAGDAVVEIATDKATVEYEVLDSGWLRKILLAEGAKRLSMLRWRFSLKKKMNRSKDIPLKGI